MALFEPSTGHLVYSGIPINSSNVSWYQSNISHLPQSPVILDRSIKDNIIYKTFDRILSITALI